MLLDTSKPGWQILFSDCDDERLNAQHTERQPFWEVFAVSDVVCALRLMQTCPFLLLLIVALTCHA